MSRNQFLVSMGVVCLSLGMPAMAGEREEFLERFARFSVEGRTSKQIQAATGDCFKFGLFKEAKGLYRHILATDPAFPARLWTEANLIKTQIELWEYDAVAKAVDELMRDYS